MINVVEVKSSKDLKKFIRFPYLLYSENPYWVPPLVFDEMNTLRKDKNPAFAHSRARYWMAYKDGKPAGRIAGIINDKYVEDSGNKHARFGWIDFIDDIEVSGALLKTVEDWAKENGMDGVNGPLGFCDLDKEGMLVEGYEELSMFITIYNFPYYPQHLEKHGYQKDIDWLEFLITVPEKIPEKISKINQFLLKKLDLKMIKVKKRKELMDYADRIFELLNEEYKNLYGFVSLTKEQVKWYTDQYFNFINPDYVRVVFDKNDEMVAFGIAFPSLAMASKKSKGKILPFGFIRLLRALNKNDRLELLLVAVRKDYQGKGVNVLLLNDINISGIENGLKYAETGPELETNKDVQSLWKYYETRQHKRRRCYLKKI
jgi:GNAT superfamily N-acetyltransferase